MIRRVALSLAAVMAVAACTEIGAPIRNDFYEWRLIVPATGGGAGLDTLAFHWAQGNVPVRIWAEDAQDLRRRMDDAIQVWKQQFLYGEFDGTLVNDSASADVIAVVGAPPSILNSKAVHLASMAPECRGVTVLDISDDQTELTLPIHIYVDPRFTPGTPGLEECLDLTTAHELGHALGLFQHSDQLDDLMSANPIVSGPTARDRETIELAYHVRATLTLNR